MKSCKIKKLSIISIFLILAFILTILPQQALAEDEPAAEKTTSESDKTEVVYASLATDGTVNDVYIVNNFSAKKSGEIVDYGNYSEVEALSLSGSVAQQDEKVIVNKVDQNFYYKGKSESKELPWNFSIAHELSGVKMTAEELAGQSGDWKMTIGIKPNLNLKEDNVWARNLMLQITVTLADDVATDIKAEQGIVAEAGSNKVISFMLMPDSQATEFEIGAKVNNFEMPSIQIAGTVFSLNMMQFDIPDLSENEDLKLLTDATTELSDASQALADGMDELNNGAIKLKEGLDQINEGGDSLTTGGEDLVNGVDEYISGVDKLAANSSTLVENADTIKNSADLIVSGFEGLSAGNDLVEGSKGIKEGLSAMSSAVSEMDSEQIAAIKEQLNAIPAQVENFKTELGTLTDSMTELSTSLGTVIEGLKGMQTALERNSILVGLGLTEEQLAANLEAQMILGYVDTVKTQSLPPLIDGLEQMKTGIDAMQDSTSITEIEGSLDSLAGLSGLSGLLDLVNGIKILAAQYGDFHTGLDAYVGGVNQLSYGFYNEDPQVVDFYYGLSAYLDGVKQFGNGVSTLGENSDSINDGVQSYTNGTNQFVSGVNEWATGYSDFSDGVQKTRDGMQKFNDGMQEFKDGTEDMDQRMNETINQMLADYDSDEVIPSFSSVKNAPPAGVQFVLMTDSIKVEKEEEPEIAEEQEKGFWDRFLDLFR